MIKKNVTDVAKRLEDDEVTKLDLGSKKGWQITTPSRGMQKGIAITDTLTNESIHDHVDSEDKRIIQRSENATFDIPTRGLTIINESGLYSLILSSKLPQAKAFKREIIIN